jgi:NAD(P)-dependent dehydrogenase (short-subunit alcohol dehydrogenase family)
MFIPPTIRSHVMSTSKTVLVTGATAGIGRTTALHLARQGHHVIASGRKVVELAKLKAEAIETGLKLDTLVLDVTSITSIADAVSEVSRLTGGCGLDVLVNNAGFGVLGPTSEISDSETRRQFETNVFGLINVTRAFIPQMRERRSGRIINVSSVGGRITLPFFGVYNATKYAVEAMSDALRYELQPFGIRVVLIEPGVIKTNFEATALANTEQFKDSVYGESMAKQEQMSAIANRFAGQPIVIAKAISRAINARRPWARYVAPRFNAMIFWMSAMLPTRMWDWAMRKAGFLSLAGKSTKSATTAAPTIAAYAPATVTLPKAPTTSTHLRAAN